MTQTSSPGGGWQGRLSAFLHVHRGSRSSRASSRKSSRASDASDLSELGGPWLNLPLLLLGGAQITANHDDKVSTVACSPCGRQAQKLDDCKNYPLCHFTKYQLPSRWVLNRNSLKNVLSISEVNADQKNFDNSGIEPAPA